MTRCLIGAFESRLAFSSELHRELVSIAMLTLIQGGVFPIKEGPIADHMCLGVVGYESCL